MGVESAPRQPSPTSTLRLGVGPSGRGPTTAGLAPALSLSYADVAVAMQFYTVGLGQGLSSLPGRGFLVQPALDTPRRPPSTSLSS